MLHGHTVIDAHVHAPRLTTVRQPWLDWADEFSRDHPWRSVYDAAGDVVPERMAELLDREGVDMVLLFSEQSPRATGLQPVDDLLPLRDHDPARFHLVATVNPHLHHPVGEEIERQLDLGAIALKLHPVHGAFDLSDRDLYPGYQLCQERGVPVIVHSGISTFPGSRSRYGNPEALIDLTEDFPDLTFVLAHGGRGWWYDVAAFLALSRENVWLDLAGLPPRKLPEYYARHDLERLAARWIFASDWPGMPGQRRNVDALAELGLTDHTLANVLAGNALRVFPGLRDALGR
ncbi:amidohydrolase family protein [Spiractinospora alimapuensis]|uniref:amidohydrolase family protein n=1 Tax=Spiractinospora alimapuensis TaxID=2820884 RepID=UPI001F4201C8|nr:amidohydrolase family protein [Spiractinospora alimapuensis]QVQ50269.1 amidohydrolase family protein [Spiractinospora alimapuensis]